MKHEVSASFWNDSVHGPLLVLENFPADSCMRHLTVLHNGD